MATETKNVLILAFSKRISDTYGQYFTDKLIQSLTEKMPKIDNAQLTVLPKLYNELFKIEGTKFILSYLDNRANSVNVPNIDGYVHLGLRGSKDVFGMVVDIAEYGWTPPPTIEETKAILANRIIKP